MKITLKELKKTKISNKYYIYLKLMHGDADKYETIDIVCKNEKEFLERYVILKERFDFQQKNWNKSLATHTEWCQTVDTWAEIPVDVTNNDEMAMLNSMQCIYFNEIGKQFIITVEE